MSDPVLAENSRQASPISSTSSNDDPRQLSSQELFKGARELTILHNDQTYLLRLTKQNKLILTK